MRDAYGESGGTMKKKKDRPKGWYKREQRKELAIAMRLVNKWIEQCTDEDHLCDLKEYLWRLEYKAVFLGVKK